MVGVVARWLILGVSGWCRFGLDWLSVVSGVRTKEESKTQFPSLVFGKALVGVVSGAEDEGGVASPRGWVVLEIEEKPIKTKSDIKSVCPDRAVTLCGGNRTCDGDANVERYVCDRDVEAACDQLSSQV